MTPNQPPITSTRQVLETIRARRRALRLTQQEIARKLGISQFQLSAMETGRRGLDIDRLLTLLNVLGLEMQIRDKPLKLKTKAEW